ncbi:hypothetical protein LINPERHAP2_LOCUS39914 [Linum perenne]
MEELGGGPYECIEKERVRIRDREEYPVSICNGCSRASES